MDMAKKLDVKLFGYYPDWNCNECSNYHGCGGQVHRNDDGTVKALLDAYGDRIQVSLVNLFSEEMKNYPDVMECVKKNGLQVPVVTLNGSIKFCGSDATIDAIKQAVDAEISKGPLSFLGRRS
jgi:hypothetical protein